MAGTIQSLAGELGLDAGTVQAACTRAGISTFGPMTPLSDDEIARVRNALAVGTLPPPPGALPGAPGSWPPGAPGATGGPPPPPPPGGWAAPPGQWPPLPGSMPLAPGPVAPTKRRKAPWILLGIVLVVVVIGVIGAIGQPSPEEAAGTTLEVFDCWNSNDETIDAVADEVIVDERSCDEQHDLQVYALVENPAPGGAPYPFDLTSDAEADCTDEFFDVVGDPGTDAALLDLTVYFVVPGPDAWDAGERTVVCSIVKLDGTPFRGGESPIDATN